MRTAVWSAAALTLSAIGLTACGESTGASASAASGAPPASASIAPQGSTPPGLVRRHTPAALREADEVACAGGDAVACRRMADRARGYGAVAGCGLPRAERRKRLSSPTGPLDVRIKRTSEDTAADDRDFVRFTGKACALGDDTACVLQKKAYGNAVYYPERMAEIPVRSEPDSSALLLFRQAVEPTVHEAALKERTRCLSESGSCYLAVDPLYRVTRAKVPPPSLPPERLALALSIGTKTLDFEAIEMLLDKEGYAPETLAPLHAAAGEVLVEACLEGSCVCGDAVRELGEDEPRALALARMGCENGEVEGCFALGRQFEVGRGVPQDKALALTLYELACPPRKPAWDPSGPRLGDVSQRACERLAEVYDSGELGPKDEDVASFYADLACRRPGYERDHRPCARLARFWVPKYVREYCSVVDCAYSYATAKARLYGPAEEPIGGKECERPSMKGLCEPHADEIKPQPKPKPSK